MHFWGLNAFSPARRSRNQKAFENAEPAETQRSGRIHEERKKAGKDLLAEPLFLPSSSGTTIRSSSHCPAQSAGGALFSSFNPSFALAAQKIYAECNQFEGLQCRDICDYLPWVGPKRPTLG
jgi:hypothetical protein